MGDGGAPPGVEAGRGEAGGLGNGFGPGGGPAGGAGEGGAGGVGVGLPPDPSQVGTRGVPGPGPPFEPEVPTSVRSYHCERPRHSRRRLSASDYPMRWPSPEAHEHNARSARR